MHHQFNLSAAMPSIELNWNNERNHHCDLVPNAEIRMNYKNAAELVADSLKNNYNLFGAFVIQFGFLERMIINVSALKKYMNKEMDLEEYTNRFFQELKMNAFMNIKHLRKVHESLPTVRGVENWPDFFNQVNHMRIMRNNWIHGAALFYNEIKSEHVLDARTAFNKLKSLRGKLKTIAKREGLF
jgi:hypothetical protein